MSLTTSIEPHDSVNGRFRPDTQQHQFQQYSKMCWPFVSLELDDPAGFVVPAAIDQPREHKQQREGEKKGFIYKRQEKVGSKEVSFWLLLSLFTPRQAGAPGV
jgi:hypothetical protein